ncbi:MAG: hypothetical protein HYZ15_00825 [Sphingobacteriales bacterium]|nr:hypothetical protein [Sphingobacteriales bacterium]
MESNFNNNDFERFLKQNADQYRMFPSENVWKGIHGSLHTRRRWHGIGLALLLLTTGTVTWMMLTIPSGKKTEPLAQRSVAANKEVSQEAVVITPPKANPVHKAPVASPGNQQQNFFLATETWDYQVNDLNGLEKATAIASISLARANPDNLSLSAPDPSGMAKTPAGIIARPAKPAADPEGTGQPGQTAPAFAQSDDLVVAPALSTVAETAAEQKAEMKREEYPLTIESVINSYRHSKKIRKAKWQLYITPTVTYRKLDENKQFINAARSNMNSSTQLLYSPDLNNLVTHRPDLGLQFGISVGFPLTKKLSIVTGFQFNISKYDIWAYNYPSELATIALSNDYGGTSTVSTVTNYRIIGMNRANKANWLRNFYYSASAPVGLEYKLLKTRKTYLGIGATIQPTYILGNRAYVISTDYKNYMEVPSLTRKWNINTGVETFAGFSVGKTAWRIGPQVRYQTMSSFKKKYPVQEHLFDYGLKLGIMLNR